jgi:hypothetical protein
VKLDASKSAEVDIKATAKVIWRAEARVELFCFFFIGLYCSLSLSRKFGAKFRKIFETTEFFETRITRIATNLMTLESIGFGSIRAGSPAAP